MDPKCDRAPNLSTLWTLVYWFIAACGATCGVRFMNAFLDWVQ